ncbi:hypothetical protein N0V90_013013 [Kalmusia sp. IMI 367209]|nr:hypothetical protein N0V90_013013 [Kalmusia sp. IMI 367209]
MDLETNLPDLTEDLELVIDDLTTALDPLLSTPLPTLTRTLPTLDKAKLHILAAYTLESLLFSALQASGANAKEHRVFAELARLKNYFAKIKAAEAAGEKPTSRLDKGAAERFIRHGLAGNERYDRERAERLAKEKARAALKARQMAVNKKFDDEVETRVQDELGRQRKAETVLEESSGSDEENEVKDASEEDHVDSENAEFYGEDTEAMDAEAPSATLDTNAKKSKKRKHSEAATKPEAEAEASNAEGDSSATPKKRGSKKKAKKRKELILPEKATGAPRTHSETFNALLSGNFAEQKKEKGQKGKKK